MANLLSIKKYVWHPYHIFNSMHKIIILLFTIVLCENAQHGIPVINFEQIPVALNYDKYKNKFWNKLIKYYWDLI
jgi:hypothetical protein